MLLALLRLGPDAYGTSIRREIEAHTGRSVSVGALYTALDRLERKGYATSALADPTPQRGGRAKRYFALSPLGTKPSAARATCCSKCGGASTRSAKRHEDTTPRDLAPVALAPSLGA